MLKVVSIVLNNFKNDSRVLKENISLKNFGYKVKVIALHENELKEFEKIDGISVHRVRLKSKSWSKKRIIQLFKYIEFMYKVISLYRNADIFHCNDLGTLPIGVIVKKFFNKKLKIVYDAHEYETEMNGLVGIEKKLKKFLERNLINYADSVITVSDAIANEYVRLYNIEKPSLVLNTPPFKQIQKKDIFREKLNIRADQTIFLYQGGLSKGRGIELLVEAFENTIDDNVIVFMGYGPLEEMIKQAASEHDSIYFYPAVTPDILLDHTSSADFGILFYENSCLNHYYCSPNKMFEYLMAEIPVIVSNLYEMKRLVEINRLGIVAENNTSNGLQEATLKAVKLDKSELKKNIEQVKKLYNWEEQEKVLFNIYKDLYEN